jgi:nitrite reductase/ring-hydroxylating ferredoxin subunit
VVRWDDRVYGYVNRCTHAGSPLDWTPDRFMSADGRHLQCATHGALFRVEDGICLRGPCNGAGLTPFTVTLTGDRVVAPAS